MESLSGRYEHVQRLTWPNGDNSNMDQLLYDQMKVFYTLVNFLYGIVKVLYRTVKCSGQWSVHEAVHAFNPLLCVSIRLLRMVGQSSEDPKFLYRNLGTS